MYLSHIERKILTEGRTMETDIESISREIKARLEIRLQEWSTCKKNSLGTPNDAPSPVRIMLFGEPGAGQSELMKLLKNITTNTTDERIVVFDTPGDIFMESTIYGAMPRRDKAVSTLAETLEIMVKGVDVFILVINTAHKLHTGLGIKQLLKTKVLNDESIKRFMVVGTHSRDHFSSRNVNSFVKQVTNITEEKEFMASINNRVVLVELGTGDKTAKSLKNKMTAYDKEREQARDMVMAMVNEVMAVNTYKIRYFHVRESRRKLRITVLVIGGSVILITMLTGLGLLISRYVL